jgi:hypothetical protein
MKKSPPKPRIPLPRKPPKVIEPPTVYKRKPKHPKKNEGGGMRDEEQRGPGDKL